MLLLLICNDRDFRNSSEVETGCSSALAATAPGAIGSVFGDITRARSNAFRVVLYGEATLERILGQLPPVFWMLFVIATAVPAWQEAAMVKNASHVTDYFRRPSRPVVKDPAPRRALDPSGPAEIASEQQ